jgi:hypothetical protein
VVSVAILRLRLRCNKVTPLLEPMINSSEFLIIDIIVGFHLGKGFQVVPDGIMLSSIIMLEENGASGIIRGVYFKFKRFARVWVHENWTGGNSVNEFLDCLGTRVIPEEVGTFFEEASQWFSNFSKVLDKGTLIA